MTGSTAALIDELHVHTAGLSEHRRLELLNHLLSKGDMIQENTGNEGVDDATPKGEQLDLLALRDRVANDDELHTMSLSDIAGVYGVSEVSLQRYVRSGRLRATRFGRKYLVTVAELKRFLATPALKAKQPRAAD